MNFFEYLLIGFLLIKMAEFCKQDARLRIEQVTEPQILSEGPHWDVASQLLYFVDILGQKILCLNPRTKKVTEAYIKNGPVGVVVPVADKKNTFIAGSGTDLVEINWDPNYNDPNPKIKVLSTVDIDVNDTRFNDGKVDPAGRFWAGTMGEKFHDGKQELIDNIGTLYRFSANGMPIPILHPVSISNGLCWSNDNKTFYYIDSLTLEIVAYDFNIETGDILKYSSALANKRIIFYLKMINDGEILDGMTIDKKGNLWIAIHAGGRVIEVDPKTGIQVRCIEIPAKQVTSVAFGGPNLDILYVTSAKEGLTAEELKEQPQSGSVFAIYGLHDTGVPMLEIKN